ncbi:group II intron maturase-specific domain-containing protein [Streptomyces sp. Ag109_G2-6]|uniref:group II intron maturase-specific domain-containing protein n=1 Tax=Streptomyces sp. Ag109_G2-6 TaxID=2485154 RepID=UPI00288C0D5B|nr:group II intron maturase-specific domain-containing protein [Streptomyces sp. Ag109_G2-6]
MRALRYVGAEGLDVGGWSAYYRTVVSSRTFSALDSYVWMLTYKWAERTHPKKSKHWIVNKYFGRLNRSKANNWVFGDRATGAHLPKFAWTNIRRHQLVRGKSSPDDPALRGYWSQRRQRGHRHRWIRSASLWRPARRESVRCAANAHRRRGIRARHSTRMDRLVRRDEEAVA